MAAITKQLVQQVDQWIARHRDEMVDEVCRLIRFPSVAGPSGVPPYGQNCREVLDAYLEIGKSHGLAARNHDYHVGELYCPQWEGKPKRIGLMGHLDVVPAGEGWIYPPFAKIHALWAENVPGLVPRHAEALLEKSGALLEKLEGLSLPEGCGWKETDEGILCWADSVSGHPSFTDIRSGVIVKLLLLLLENGLAEDEGDRETLAFAAKAPARPTAPPWGLILKMSRRAG